MTYAPGFGPPTLLPANQTPFPNCHNYRQFSDGFIQPRAGLVNLGLVAAGFPVHSIFRLNDPTPLATHPALRVVGIQQQLFVGYPGTNTYTDILGGWSGSPLSAHACEPPDASQPWLYIVDSNQMKKVNVNVVLYNVGIAPPLVPPAIALQPLPYTTIDRLNNIAAWSLAGNALAPSQLLGGRLAPTTIGAILYDNFVPGPGGNPPPGATGWASITLTSFQNVTQDMLLDIGTGANFETALVEGITVPIAFTTIKSILYDNPQTNTGLCTIQPAASLGTGQIEAPPPGYSLLRSGPYAESIIRNPGGVTPPGFNVQDIAPTGVSQISQIDFPVNCVVNLIGYEPVRILSVAVGNDKVQSFRCSTVNTIPAGTSISGLPAIRVYLANRHVAGEIVGTGAITQTLTAIPPPGSPSVSIIGGIQLLGTALNLAQVGATVPGLASARAIQPDDDIHLGLMVNRLSEVTAVRIYLDVNANAPSPTTTFVDNYYFFEWRANDLIAAIQATNAAPVSSLDTTAATAIAAQQLNQTPNWAALTDNGKYSVVVQGGIVVASTNPAVPPGTYATGQPATPTSNQLLLGNNQWLDLHCKVRDLIHAGADPSRTLSTVTSIEILVSANATANLQVSYNAWFLSGGYGADIGTTGAPYVYRMRYRAKSTGVVSIWGPQSPAGVLARRQRVKLTSGGVIDPQVDTIDFARFGGGLTQWTYNGSVDLGLIFDDDYADADIIGSQPVTFTDYQPWPVADLPRKGVCNVSGNAVQWVSGDTFNPLWAPGSVIFLNGIPCTLYASPSAFYAAFNLSPILFTNENVSNGLDSTVGVQFYLPSPTVQGQPLPTLWGDILGYHFACGDPLNPSTLYWTNGSMNIDSASEANTLVVTNEQSSEPLQNGCIWDSTAYVFSTQDLYRIEPVGAVSYANGVAITSSGGSLFNTTKTSCGRGLWTRWAFAVRPEGIYFLAADGVFLTQGGSPAKPITEGDLRALFPHDGQPGEAVAVGAVTIQPPNMALSTSLRLTEVDNLLYFDYVDTSGNPNTLVYDPLGQQWLLDQYTTGAGSALQISSRLREQGPGIHSQLAGGGNGTLYQVSGTTDDGWIIPALWATAPVAYGPGFSSVHDMVLAYQASAALTLIIGYDGSAQVYTLPSTSGLYQRVYGLVAPGKGMAITYGLMSPSPFRVFKEDCAVRVQPWGRPGGYVPVQPFGGARLKDGAVV